MRTKSLSDPLTTTRHIALVIAFSLTIAVVLATVAFAGDAPTPPFVPVYHPELKVARAAGPIKIDGDLSDAGWRGAAKASNFAEHEPGNQTKPAVDTDAYITYDDQYLYVGFMCYDKPGEVRASFCERDKIFSDDVVFLCLDTYGEATMGYEIAVNPYGIPGDLLFSPNSGEDITYDMIYKTASRIVDNGWIAEMAIPFSSLRFPDKPEQTWRVDFWRNRPRDSHFQYSWAAYDRKENCWPCQWGSVTGISGIKPGKGVELLPAVVAHQSGALGDNGDFDNGNVKSELSLGAAYDISSELSAEATLNPDFSQVETDVAQIDVNSTFALFYPEKRPFFQEGSDLFTTTFFNAVYTRAINDPTFGGKMTSRSGANSLAFLSARDEHSAIILPFEESSAFVENGKSYSNILRYKRDFGNQSQVGLVATDRRFDGGGAGSLAGVDGQILFTKMDGIRFQVLASHTEEVNNLALVPDSAFNAMTFDDGKYTAGLDGESYWGHAVSASIARNADTYSLGMDYSERSPTFRADNGFEPQNNVRAGSVFGSYMKRYDKSPVLNYISIDANGAQEYNFDDVKKDEWVATNLQIQTRAAQAATHVSYMASNELYHGIQFNGIWQVHNCYNVKPSGALTLSGNINYGHRIARYQLEMGRQLDYGVSATVKPVSRLTLNLTYNHTQSDAVDTGERLFAQSVFWSRVSLQFTRELSMRLVSQYNDRYRAWEIDPLITYRINSLTMFYIGSTHNYSDFGTMEGAPAEGWNLTNRQFFLKLQYLFRT